MPASGRNSEAESPNGGLLGGENKDIPSANTSSDFKLYRVMVWFDNDANSYKYSVLDAEMVLVGKINQQIINSINQHGGKAVGLSGKEGQIIIY